MQFVCFFSHNLLNPLVKQHVDIEIHDNMFAEQKSGTMSVDTALDLLQAAAAEIEQDSEVCSSLILFGFS